EIDGSSDGLVEGESPVAVGGLVSELPELQVIGLGDAVQLAFLVVGIVGVRYPICGLSGVRGAIAFGSREKSLLPVAQKIHAVGWLRADATAEIDKLVRADA